MHFNAKIECSQCAVCTMIVMEIYSRLKDIFIIFDKYTYLPINCSFPKSMQLPPTIDSEMLTSYFISNGQRFHT